MTLAEFTGLIEKQEIAPLGLPKALEALWYDKKGDWHRAHQIVQDASDRDSAWVHGYLHRKEGDISNARYWYQRSSKSEFTGGLTQEWDFIASELLLKISESF